MNNGRNITESPRSKNHELLTPSHKYLDLLNRDAVAAYLEKNRPNMVIHAAGVKRFINLGSSCMYPRNHDTPLTEDMILTGELEPTNEGYALAKVTCARMCSYIMRENPEYQYKTLIPCNLYGRWDKFLGDKAHMIPAVIHKLYRAVEDGQDVIEIWGDGSARREFMYAGDLADCIWHAVERFDELPPLMNVGTGTDYSVDEYYRAVAQVVGYKGTFTHDLTKPAGMKRKLTDVTRMLKFGWRPQTTLLDGIRQTVEFYREHYGKQSSKIGIGWAFISKNGK